MSSCPANVRETKLAFGYQPQADLATANTAPELWSLTKTNPALTTVTPVTEDDANDIGKGDEFPTTVFPVNMDVSTPVEKFASSEYLAWVFCFATGKATKASAGTGFKYSAVPSDPVVNCINLTPFTVVEQIRSGADAVVDRAAIGMVVSEFAIMMESGPGRANCRVTSTWVGTGKTQVPSALVVPAVTQEHFLNAASATININGIDYVTAQSFMSMEFRWNNNVRLPSGFYPGSGSQNGFALRGRMEYGNREVSLSFVARASKGSVEFNNLINLHEASTVITLSGANLNGGPAKHGMEINCPRTQISAAQEGEADGLVTINCSCRILKPPTGDLLTMSATTGQDGILGL